jgi:hypothetical protein
MPGMIETVLSNARIWDFSVGREDQCVTRRVKVEAAHSRST